MYKRQQILRSGAAARKPLGHARSLAQIQHKVEEFKAAAFLFPLYKFLCQTVVLLHDLGKVLFTDGIRSLRRRYNWLHRQLFKAQVCKVQYVIGKVQVVSRKGPSYEIILISSCLLYTSYMAMTAISGGVDAVKKVHAPDVYKRQTGYRWRCTAPSWDTRCLRETIAGTPVFL